MTRDEIAGLSKANGGMFAVIPAVVMKDKALSMSAWMLYGVITWKCNESSRCWPTNRSLGEELGLSAKRISALLSLLEARGHIEMETIYDNETRQVLRRYIYPIMKSSRSLAQDDRDTPLLENEDTPIPENKDTHPHDQVEPPPRNAEDKRKEETKTISPYSPPSENDTPKKPRKGRAHKSEASWKPERFSKFWDYYPRGENRQAAIRAWDKLQPDDELIAKMGAALKRQMLRQDWKEGIGIPHASTWINQSRWEDEEKTLPTSKPEAHKPRAYHMEIIDGEEVVVYDS